MSPRPRGRASLHGSLCWRRIGFGADVAMRPTCRDAVQGGGSRHERLPARVPGNRGWPRRGGDASDGRRRLHGDSGVGRFRLPPHVFGLGGARFPGKPPGRHLPGRPALQEFHHGPQPLRHQRPQGAVRPRGGHAARLVRRRDGRPRPSPGRGVAPPGPESARRLPGAVHDGGRHVPRLGPAGEAAGAAGRGWGLGRRPDAERRRRGPLVSLPAHAQELPHAQRRGPGAQRRPRHLPADDRPHHREAGRAGGAHRRSGDDAAAAHGRSRRSQRRGGIVSPAGLRHEPGALFRRHRFGAADPVLRLQGADGLDQRDHFRGLERRRRLPAAQGHPGRWVRGRAQRRLGDGRGDASHGGGSGAPNTKTTRPSSFAPSPTTCSRLRKIAPVGARTARTKRFQPPAT